MLNILQGESSTLAYTKENKAMKRIAVIEMKPSNYITNTFKAQQTTTSACRSKILIIFSPITTDNPGAISPNSSAATKVASLDVDIQRSLQDINCRGLSLLQRSFFWRYGVSSTLQVSMHSEKLLFCFFSSEILINIFVDGDYADFACDVTSCVGALFWWSTSFDSCVVKSPRRWKLF